MSLLSRVNMSDIQVVSFDLWLTLLRSNAQVKPARAVVMCREFGLSPERADEVLAVSREVDRATDRLSDQDGRQYGPRERLAGIAERLAISVTPDWLERVAVLVQEPIVAHTPVLKESDLLASLALIKASGRRIVSSSNTGFIDGKYMRLALAANGIAPYLDASVYSNEVGVAKPSAEFFDAVVEAAKVERPAILHVGDNLQADYHGALSAGLKPCWLTDQSPADIVTVSSIAELAGLLVKEENSCTLAS